MPVLSDETIQKAIARGELVLDGDPASAVHCAYDFTAEVLFRGASSGGETIGGSGVVVGPGEVVWVRAKERVSAPEDVVGIFIQTQTLSRQGLLLLNTTLVEPGYRGPLTAVFVNFGTRRVVLSENAKIAKVMFLKLDRAARALVGPQAQPDYDAGILQIASNSPKSFLQLEQMLPSLERETARRVQELDREGMNQVGRMKAAAAEIVPSLREELRSEVNQHGLKWMGGLALGFVAASFAVWYAVGVVFPALVEHYGNLNASVERSVQVGNAPLLQQMQVELQRSRVEVEQLKRDMAELSAARTRPTKTRSGAQQRK